jgi:hypothetical protein
MKKITSLFLFLFVLQNCFSQGDVQVRYDYDASGNATFGADNYTNVPVYLVLDFSFLNNASFSENLPYIKRIDPGSTELFIIYKELEQPSPDFNIEYKWYNSNPAPKIDDGFPYLLPAKPGTITKIINIKAHSRDRAIGFELVSSDEVFAMRKGVVVDVKENSNLNLDDQKQLNYVHILHVDGTIGEYFNFAMNGVDCIVGEKIIPGQKIGKAHSAMNELAVIGFTLFHSELASKRVRYIIPKFYLGKSKGEQLSVGYEYKSLHPTNIVGKELTRKEKKSLK